MRIITIKAYEMCNRARWGWHTFRAGKDHKGAIVGSRVLGVGLWSRLKRFLSAITEPSCDGY